MTQGKRSLPGVAFLDFLANLLLLFVALFALTFLLVHPKNSNPAIVTPGYYAVVVTWPDGSRDDVDTYVQDPARNVVFFADPSTGLMHLEQDDLGTGITNATSVNGKKFSVQQNVERVVLQGFIPGEYTVNVFMYTKRMSGPTTVKITLYDVHRPDTPVTTETVVLSKDGQEKTAFRFTLDQIGRVTNISHTPKNIAYAAMGYGSSVVVAPTSNQGSFH